MDHFLQLLASGVVTGGIYALVAVGFVIVYKATGIINFATGELMMLGAFFAYTAMAAARAPFALALLVAVVAAAGLGALVERAVLRPLLGQRAISVIMVTIGLSSIFKGIAQMIWSGEYRAFPPIFPRAPLVLGPVILPSRQVWPFAIALLAILLVGLGFRFTRTGTAMRATADDQQAAFAMGIDIRRVFSLSWSLAAVTAAVAGVVVGTIAGISPQLGAIGLRMFPVVILGGLDSIPGALVGGVAIGILENMAGGYLDPLLDGGGVKEVVPFVALVAILMIRPYGLFGTREVERL
ncbi:MAG TPA: branched-chain amino acid ABC transporter permease [Anaeromyxobacteraceae bacterium]|nr:branched-chain amino acid ABC transporter permease [Anaeromyxobacteraceae bacterium]